MSDDALGTPRGLAANAASLMVAEVVGKAATFVFVVIVARGLGPEQYGHFAFAFAFLPLFLHLARWGVDAVTLRRISAHPQEFSAAYANAAVVRVGLALAATLVGLGLSPLLANSDTGTAVVAVLAAAMLLDELAVFLSVGFTAAEQMHVQALVLIANRVLSTLLTGLVVAAGGGIVAVCMAYAAGSLGAVVVSCAFFARRLPTVRRADVTGDEVRSILKVGAPLGIASFLNMAVLRVDAVLLQAIKGPVAVGIYGVAYRFFEPLLFVTWTVAHAAVPRLVREARAGQEGRTLELCMTAVLAFYLPVAAGTPFVAAFLVEVVFGAEYLVAVDAVKWLAGGAVFYGIAHMLRTAAIAAGEGRTIAYVAGTSLAANLVLNVVLIPRYGVTGAAAATFVTEVVESLLLAAVYVRRVDALRPTATMAVPVVATACMVAALWAAPRGAVALAIAPVAFLVSLVPAGRVLAPADAAALVASLKARGAAR